MSSTKAENLSKAMKVEDKTKVEDFGYLNLATAPELDWPKQEGFKEKIIRKTKQNPFVPIGLGVTTFALTYGIWQIKTGDRIKSQKMMRLRVGAQAFTVVALLCGVVYNTHQDNLKRAATAAAQTVPK